MGIRKKIILGFVSLIFLFFLAGLICFSELNRIHFNTQDMMDASMKNITLSKYMLDGVQDQNTALSQMMLSGITPENDSLWHAGRMQFQEALLQAKAENFSGFDSVSTAAMKYILFVDSLIHEGIDKQNPEWFAETYKTLYYDLTSSIKNMMLSSQNMIARESKHIERSAYMAFRPGIIAFVIAIIIVAMFCYFIDTYFIKPILKINKGLKNFIAAKVPFKVKFESKDEINDLKEYIEELTEEIVNLRGK